MLNRYVIVNIIRNPSELDRRDGSLRASDVGAILDTETGNVLPVRYENNDYGNTAFTIDVNALNSGSISWAEYVAAYV